MPEPSSKCTCAPTVAHQLYDYEELHAVARYQWTFSRMTKTTVDQSERRSDSRHEHCPLPSGILAETDRPHGGAVPCRRDICGRSASEQQTFSDTSCRRRSSRCRERRTPP